MALSWLLGKEMLLSGNPLRALVVSGPSRGKGRRAGTSLTARLLTEDRKEVEVGVFQARPRGSGRLRHDAYCVELTPTSAWSALGLERGSEHEELYRPVEVMGDEERDALIDAMTEAFSPSPGIRGAEALERLTGRVLRERVPRIWLGGRFVSGSELRPNASWAGPPVPSAPVIWATEALVAELFDVAVFGARAIDLSTSVTDGVLQLRARIEAPEDQPFSESLRSAPRDRNELYALYRAARPDFEPTIDVGERILEIGVRLQLEAPAASEA